MIVSFEDIVNTGSKGKGFGSERYIASYKERAHISKSKLDANSDATYLRTGQHIVMKAEGWKGQRYVVATDLSYDLLVCIYEINSSSLAVLRIFKHEEVNEKLVNAIEGICGKSANLEARIIGLQNREAHQSLGKVLEALKKFKNYHIPLVEIDLFGGELRHIAIDTKTGMTFNVLLEDRSYRPGELANPMTIIDFERSLKVNPLSKNSQKHIQNTATAPQNNPAAKGTASP